MGFRKSVAWTLAVLWLIGAWFPQQGWSQKSRRLPSQRHASLRARAEVPVQHLPSINEAALRAEDRTHAGRVGPYRYGRTLNTDFRPERHGTWEQLRSGDWLWRLRIRSRDAVSLSVGFTTFDLPPGASLYLHGPGGGVIRGPYTAADATAGQLWTPLVRGEEIVLELIVPPARRPDVSLVVGHVVHGYRPLPSRRRDGVQAKSGTCNLDVACPKADPWRKQVRAVGGYTLRRGDDQLFCSGVLINNTARNPRPLFLTAEHCVQSPDDAASMVFYWNFQTARCRVQGSVENGTFPADSLDLAAWEQTSSGALLRARYGSIHEDGTIGGKPDLTLVEIDDTIPAQYELYLAGWSRKNRPTQQSVTIHHPSGHAKRISFDEDPSRITGWARTDDGTTHLRIGNWEDGTTERGSSGGPLFNRSKRIVGVLSGGVAGCGNDGDADDNNEPDWYGRLAAGFNNGDYRDATFADWLDPTNTGAKTVSGRPLVQDSIPPARPLHFRVATVTPRSVTLRWTAPGDDGRSGTAATYLLRRLKRTPIETKADFERATPVTNVPAPKPAGSPQSVTVSVNPDTSYYFALVALDGAKNASPLSATDRDATPVSTLRVLTPPAPNPARRRSTLEFVVKERQTVRIALYDPLGRRLRVLFDDEVPPFRRQTLRTDVSSLASGVYFIRIRGATTARTVRIAVVR